MSFFLDLLATAGATTALIGGATFLTKALVTHKLTQDLEAHKQDLQLALQMEVEQQKATFLRDIESHKAALALENARSLDAAKFEFEKELIAHRGEVDLVKEGYKYSTESEKQRSERLRSQIQRWALPIQGAISDLTHRLNDILQNDGNIMLKQDAAGGDGWSATYAYYMPSTLYYFAQYFCWTRLLQQQLGHELFQSSDEMSEYFRMMAEISSTIGRFPYRDGGDPDAFFDRQIFALQQRAVGELLVVTSGPAERILSYREFLDRWLDPTDHQFSRHIEPLELFLRELRPSRDLRWERLADMRKRLANFEHACHAILQAPAQTDA